VPQGVVRADDKDLQAPVGVPGDHGGVDPAAQGGPAAPAVVGCGLPHVPQGVVRAAREHLHAGTRTATHDAFGRPHLSVEPAASVAHPEVAALTPASPPLVLRDPATLAVVVANDADAVPTDHVAGRCRVVGIDPAGVVVVEVLIDGEAGTDRTHRRDERLHIGLRGQVVPAGDLRQPVLPVRAQVASLVGSGIGVAGGVDDALLESVIGGIRPPAASRAGTGTVRGAPAEPQMRLGQVDTGRWGTAADTDQGLHSGHGTKSYAGTATSLVLDWGDVVQARPVTPVECCRGRRAPW